MKDLVAKYLNGTISQNDLKYFVHSAHDTQIWNEFEFFEPLKNEPIDMPYASTIFIELHYDSKCVADPKTRGTQCFSVQVLNNGDLLKFDTCVSDNNLNGRQGSPICSFDSFIRHFEKKSYKGDYRQKCLEKYIPPTGPYEIDYYTPDDLFLH